MSAAEFAKVKELTARVAALEAAVAALKTAAPVPRETLTMKPKAA